MSERVSGGGGEEDGGKEGRKEGRMRAGWQPTKLEPHTEMWGKTNLGEIGVLVLAVRILPLDFFKALTELVSVHKGRSN